MWNKPSTNWQKLSDSSIRALRRSLLWKDAETTSLAWSAFTHLCSSEGSTYVDQATKARIKLWLWNVGEIERAQPKKKKEKKKEKDGKERSNAPAETPFQDTLQAPLEDLDNSAKMKKNSNLKHDVSRWTRPARLAKGNVLVELEATMVDTSIRGLCACPELAQALLSTCNKQNKKNVLVPCPTCNSLSHKLSTKLTKSDKESRLDVDNQTETGPCLSSSSIPPNGVGTRSRDSIHLPWFRTLTRQKRALSARMPALIAKAGADSLSKRIFLPIGDHGILGSLRRAFSPLWHPPTSPWMDDEHR